MIALLFEMEQPLSVVSRETLCRWGRWWKNRGDQFLKQDGGGDVEMSRTSYNQVFSCYKRGYCLSRDYYMDINVAALHQSTSRMVGVVRLALTIIDNLSWRYNHRGDDSL